MTENELQQKIDDSKNEIDNLKKRVEKIERETIQFLKTTALLLFISCIIHYLVIFC